MVVTCMQRKLNTSSGGTNDGYKHIVLASTHSVVARLIEHKMIIFDADLLVDVSLRVLIKRVC